MQALTRKWGNTWWGTGGVLMMISVCDKPSVGLKCLANTICPDKGLTIHV